MDLYGTAIECGQIAARMSLEFAQKGVTSGLKPDKTWVTQADLEIEAALRDFIMSRFPESHILGEEQGGAVGPGITWILDPIDGTFSFLHGVPFYSNLIGVLVDGVPTIGVAGLPGMGILMAAEVGKGLTISGVPYVKPVANPNRELFATADAYRFFRQGHEAQWIALNQPPFKSRTYPDALGYYLLLTGSLTAFVDPMTEVWDVAPFHVILPEAGCRIQSWSGGSELSAGPVVSFRCDALGRPQGCAEILAVLR